MRLPFVSRAIYDQVVREKQIAEDRLYAAWKDGYTVPPRESVVQKPRAPIQLLPSLLHDFVNNWESEDTRRELEAEARRMHFDLGMPEERILELFAARQHGVTS